jgi:non-ribosomal peptide synthetase component E (peptide arylation enzyme)
MILSDLETQKQYLDAGTWGKVTLDGLLARAARKSGRQTGSVYA